MQPHKILKDPSTDREVWLWNWRNVHAVIAEKDGAPVHEWSGRTQYESARKQHPDGGTYAFRMGTGMLGHPMNSDHVAEPVNGKFRYYRRLTFRDITGKPQPRGWTGERKKRMLHRLVRWTPEQEARMATFEDTGMNELRGYLFRHPTQGTFLCMGSEGAAISSYQVEMGYDRWSDWRAVTPEEITGRNRLLESGELIGPVKFRTPSTVGSYRYSIGNLETERGDRVVAIPGLKKLEHVFSGNEPKWLKKWISPEWQGFRVRF
jgi:hypothetical protein